MTQHFHFLCRFLFHLRWITLVLAAALISGWAQPSATETTSESKPPTSVDRSNWSFQSMSVGPPPYIACHDNALMRKLPKKAEEPKLWVGIPQTAEAYKALLTCGSMATIKVGQPSSGYAGDASRDKFFNHVAQCMSAAGYLVEADKMLIQPGYVGC